uniref:DUF2911 domain-containing protein n=1 Tax=Steinernema glaseri TaxID=37863 RepID=A0A1I7YBR0_9BILA
MHASTSLWFHYFWEPGLTFDWRRTEIERVQISASSGDALVRSRRIRVPLQDRLHHQLLLVIRSPQRYRNGWERLGNPRTAAPPETDSPPRDRQK